MDAINTRSPSGASENTVLGPFHVSGSSEYEMGANICLDVKGEDLLVSGRIIDAQWNPISNAKIDVWQANDEGFYDVKQKGVQQDYDLKGVFHTDQDGGYLFKGVRPKYYPIPTDGPIVKLLENLGRHPFRLAYLHYFIINDGYENVTNHIFDPDHPYIKSDSILGLKESLIADFIRISDPEKLSEHGFNGGFYWE